MEKANKTLRLGVLASHGGSNLQSIIDGCESGQIQAVVCCVISNNAHAKALDRARNHNIPAYHICRAQFASTEEHDQALVATLQRHDVELVCLAGYMKLIGLPMLQQYRNRIINIHPALLPKFGGKGMFGMNVHKAVIANREQESGATVHLINEHYDEGRIIAQEKVPVLPDDTAEELAARVLEQEHQLYPRVVGQIACGEIILD